MQTFISFKVKIGSLEVVFHLNDGISLTKDLTKKRVQLF